MSPPARWIVTGLSHHPFATAAAGDGDGARARRERLPRPALPDADGRLARRVDADELDVRARREALVVLDERPEAEQFVATRARAG